MLLAAVFAFQGCMCTWGQGDNGQGCDTGLGSNDAPYQHGENCYAQGGACVSVDNACPESQQIASDCYSTEMCCPPPSDASPDASTDQESEATSDARNDADASPEDGFGDTALMEGGDGSAEATVVDASSDEVAETNSEPSGD